MKTLALLALAAGTMTPYALAQAPCRGSAIHGIVRDKTGALVPGASLTLDGKQTASASADGSFHFACVANGQRQFVIAHEGFATLTTALRAPHAEAIAFALEVEGVETSVTVNADEAALDPGTSNASTQTITGNRLQSLADDPDDLQTQLQQMAALAGGSPTGATISVDGFQDSSHLPPKNSIAYIKVNPDMFSAEYREPPFGGGRVEIYTKPGQDKFHGALFATNGSPWMNARDPFSTSKASLGKQRYGFEFSGPITRKGSDFFLNLEHRSIDNFAVVNAVTLNGNQTSPFVTNVPNPQRLWVGNAKTDWQLGAKNTLIVSLDSWVNNRQNNGVGGTNLPETGYNMQAYDENLHITNVTTISSKLMNEARVGLRWMGETETPLSTAPSVQVAGAFTSGGAAIGNQRTREFRMEIDEDAILTTGKHTLKFGTFFFNNRERLQLTSGFNGSYTFGGVANAVALDANDKVIPGQTTAITGLEQYRRTKLGLPNGTPTAFTGTVGTPAVNYTDVNGTLFIQDDWKVGHGLQISAGLRYYIQRTPVTLSAITPRLSIVYAPGKDPKWTLHARWGLFAGRYGIDDNNELYRQDGVSRITTIDYNSIFDPVHGDPNPGTAGVRSMRTLAPGLSNFLWGGENIGATRSLPHGWNLSAEFVYGRIWNFWRTVNINTPTNGSPTGPRPYGPNLNILQVQNSGQGRVDAEVFNLSQQSFKRAQFSVGTVRVAQVDDTNDDNYFSPQSSTSNAGEFARRSNQFPWMVFANGTFQLPAKVSFSPNIFAGGPRPFNITTGQDNNGDGNFNDRPQYALPGSAGVVHTQWGDLVSSGGTGVFGRNRGRLPWSILLDANLQRAFTLSGTDKSDHKQTLTVNLRANNLLNHTNVTSVGGVLGSPLFGISYAAQNGRRVEAGLRYSF